MTASEILRECQAAGLTLRVEPPDHIVIRGPKASQARLLPAIKSAKPELLKILSAPADPLVELYGAFLADRPEERVLMTLDDDQVRQAVAAGAVTQEVARASVLLLVKVPKGDAGPGAAGLLAVPREKYRDFSPTAAVDALGSWH